MPAVCTALLLVLSLVWHAAAVAACSNAIGKVMLNEYNHQDDFVEAVVMDSSQSLSGWKIRLYSDVGSYVEKALPAVAPDKCGDYHVVNFANNETPTNADIVLLDGVNNVVDILRTRTTNLPVTTALYAPYPTCDFPGPTTDLKISTAQKGVDRSPNAFGVWRNTPGTGSGSYTTRCASNTPGNSNTDLAVSQTANTNATYVGFHVIFTLTVTNHGPLTAFASAVRDVLPAGLSFVSASATTGSYSSTTGVWTIGDLTVGASATLTLTATPTVTAAFTNSASVSSDNTDTNTANNTASVAFTVLSLHHLELHANGVSSGSTCTPISLGVIACLDAACSGRYLGGVTGNLAAAGTPTVNWTGGTGFIIAAGSGSTSKMVQVTSAGSVVFGVAATPSPATASGTLCDFGSPMCTYTVAGGGFSFDVQDHFAETTQTMTISAFKSSAGGGCVAAFSNVSKTINFTCRYHDPASGFLPVRVGGRALNSGNDASAACDGTGQPVNLSFDASGVATTSVQYADVGGLVLDASYTGSGSEAGLVIEGKDGFIVAPASFTFDSTTAGPIKAGSPFATTVTARNSAGAATPNFGRETIPEGVTLGVSKYQPTGSGASAGTFSGSVRGFSSGSASGTNLIWNEVGTIDLSATLTSGSYIGSGLSASGSTGSTGAVGRFIPHHFITSVTPGCNSFSYSGQPFMLSVRALNASDGTTVNYDGTAATTPNFAKAMTLSEVNGVAGSLVPTTVAASAFLAGVATIHPAFTFASRQTPPASIVMRATDSDAVSSNGFSEFGASIRGGRLRLGNAYGSELLDLPVPLFLEYWQDNTAGWKPNTADTCTTLSADQFSFSFPSGNLAACETALSTSGAAPNRSLRLSAPGSGNGGSMDLSWNLGITASGNVCTTVGGTGPASTPAAQPWLQYDWNGDGVYADNPGARLVFGIYKSNLIDLRERY